MWLLQTEAKKGKDICEDLCQLVSTSFKSTTWNITCPGAFCAFTLSIYTHHTKGQLSSSDQNFNLVCFSILPCAHNCIRPYIPCVDKHCLVERLYQGLRRLRHLGSEWHRTISVPQITTRGDTMWYPMAPLTLIPGVLLVRVSTTFQHWPTIRAHNG